jgi:hypothetical protein
VQAFERTRTAAAAATAAVYVGGWAREAPGLGFDLHTHSRPHQLQPFRWGCHQFAEIGHEEAWQALLQHIACLRQLLLHCLRDGHLAR